MTVYYFRPVIHNGFKLDYLEECDLSYSAVDFIDASTTAIFLIGMWMMAKRKIDNWFFWIIGDMIMVPLMIYKGAVITSSQYIILLIISFIGIKDWIKSAK